MSASPMSQLAQAIRQHGLVRFMEHYAREYPDTHLKDLLVDQLGPNREMNVAGRRVINFGSDSFLGLDQELHDGVHVILHQAADIAFHRGDVAIDRQPLEAVLIKLTQLNVKDRRNQLAGQRTGPLLGLLLVAENVNVGGGNRRAGCQR